MKEKFDTRENVSDAELPKDVNNHTMSDFVAMRHGEGQKFVFLINNT